ncbi:PAP21 [Symbiodinium microadriaticum]|nr:PAP21 [Symbiodinium microadriaticum]
MGAPETTTEYLLSIQDTTDFAYDEVTGEHFSNWYNYSRVDWGMGRYNNPDVIYDSPLLHRVVLDGLTPGKKYFYRVQGSCKVYSFSLPPSATASPTDFPYRIGLTADIGQTLVSEKSVQALLALLPDVVLLPGDLSYADGYMYFTPHQGSGSPNMGYWAKAVGPVLVIALNSYSNMTRGSTQYEWADSYLSSKVDRYLTPWVVVMMHVPWYNSNTGHWKEAERGRQHMEPLLFQYGVDVIIAGHVHSYERTHPILEFERNECGPMYLNLGDGGNYEGGM